MRLTPPLLAAALALAITGCADDGAGPGPTAPQNESTPAAPSTSSGSTASPEEAAPSSTPTDTGKPFDPEEFTTRLEAAVEETPTVRIDVQVQMNETMSAAAKGVQDLRRNALDMDLDLGNQQLGYLLVDGQYYLAQPPKWVPVEEDSDNPAVGQTLQQIQILSMRNQLDAFVAGVEQAGTKGKEKVGGVSTTHYTASVDSQRALAELGMEKAPGTADTILYDVWLDDDDLIRKMSFSANGVSAEVMASEWGQPVDISTPKPSEIAQSPDSGTP
ncbi:LppX_LprAFG lipoprotein [Janibacter alittae]|uniref:LppX_LprAFG lipoprotein n=1 Tax=Janibacter alittae TaxID=3115209 RepID=A0ABZ2MIF8_9MICO